MYYTAMTIVYCQVQNSLKHQYIVLMTLVTDFSAFHLWSWNVCLPISWDLNTGEKGHQCSLQSVWSFANCTIKYTYAWYYTCTYIKNGEALAQPQRETEYLVRSLLDHIRLRWNMRIRGHFEIFTCVKVYTLFSIIRSIVDVEAITSRVRDLQPFSPYRISPKHGQINGYEVWMKQKVEKMWYISTILIFPPHLWNLKVTIHNCW